MRREYPGHWAGSRRTGYQPPAGWGMLARMSLHPEEAGQVPRRSRARRLAIRLAWPALLLLAVATRIGFLAQWPANFDADEALVGLHAREILAGRFSLFLPGQSYMGALQSLIAAPWVALFGPSATAVRLSPLLWVPLGLWVLRAWQRRATEDASRRPALRLALVWLLPPAVLFLAGVKARGGYLESLVLGLLGTLLLWPARRESGSRCLRDSLLGGVLLGLAVWTHDQALLFVPAALALLVGQVAARWRPRPAGVLSLGVAALGFLAGYLPLWLPRLVPAALGPPGTEGTGWAPELASILRPALLADLARAFPAALTTGTWSSNEAAVALALFTLVYLVVSALGVIDWIRAARRRRAWLGAVDPGLALAAYLGAGGLAVLLVTPEFRNDPQWFRYTLPLTPFLVLSAARGLGVWPARHVAPIAVCLAILGAITALSATAAWVLPQASLRPLLARELLAQGHREVISDWELAYFLRLHTRDEILAASYTPPRFPDVNARVSASPEALIVLARRDWRPPGSADAVAGGRADASELAAAFQQSARPDPPDPRLRAALAALDPRRTLYARFEPFPLLRPVDFERDWRGWPPRRPLERFEAIVWDPYCPAPVPDELLARRLGEVLAAGGFSAAFEGGGWAVYTRAQPRHGTIPGHPQPWR